jgi:hypothetical protein
MSFGIRYMNKFDTADADLEYGGGSIGTHERLYGLGDTPTTSGDVQEILTRLGINAPQAAMAAGASFFTVGGSNPSAPTTMILVKACQAALNAIAIKTGEAKLAIDGILGAHTQARLGKYVPGFPNKPYLTVLVELRNKFNSLPGGGSKPLTIDMSDEPEVIPRTNTLMSGFGGKWAWVALAGAVGVYFMTKKKGA